MNLEDRIRTAPDTATISFHWKSDDKTQSGESDFYELSELRELIGRPHSIMDCASRLQKIRDAETVFNAEGDSRA